MFVYLIKVTTSVSINQLRHWIPRITFLFYVPCCPESQPKIVPLYLYLWNWFQFPKKIKITQFREKLFPEILGDVKGFLLNFIPILENVSYDYRLTSDTFPSSNSNLRLFNCGIFDRVVVFVYYVCCSQKLKLKELAQNICISQQDVLWVKNIWGWSKSGLEPATPNTEKQAGGFSPLLLSVLGLANIIWW